MTLGSGGERGALLVFLKRFENQIAHAVLRRHVDDRAEQREAAAFAIDAVLSGRKGDIAAATAAAAFPDAEANQLQPFERSIVGGEVNLGVGEFARRVALVVWRNLDGHVARSSWMSA